MAPREFVANTIAATLLAGEWSEAALAMRMAEAIGKSGRRVQRNIVRHVISTNPNEYPPSPEWLVRQLLETDDFHKLANMLARRRRPVAAELRSPKFQPVPGFVGLSVPQLATGGELAAWLELSIDELDWFADERRQHSRSHMAALQHYHVRAVAKRSGGFRLIEAPKARLKNIQVKILRQILDLVPPNRHAHGFVRGRSCITSAQVHAGEALVVKLDLRNFFPATPVRRVHGVFRSIGYPWAVARLLTGICCTMTPRSRLADISGGFGGNWEFYKLAGAPHLPQGAPTSPSLANLCAWRLDQRLAALAACFGANYSRYADDLAISGDPTFGEKIGAFLRAIEKIVEEEGYRLNRQKTRIMRAGGRQILCGIVVNSHVNPPRTYYDNLKAVLHNCAKNGPRNENRDGRVDFRASLDGRIAWLESVNPARASKLRTLFQSIDWRESTPI